MLPDYDETLKKNNDVLKRLSEITNPSDVESPYLRSDELKDDAEKLAEVEAELKNKEKLANIVARTRKLNEDDNSSVNISNDVDLKNPDAIALDTLNKSIVPNSELGLDDVTKPRPSVQELIANLNKTRSDEIENRKAAFKQKNIYDALAQITSGVSNAAAARGGGSLTQLKPVDVGASIKESGESQLEQQQELSKMKEADAISRMKNTLLGRKIEGEDNLIAEKDALKDPKSEQSANARDMLKSIVGDSFPIPDTMSAKDIEKNQNLILMKIKYDRVRNQRETEREEKLETKKKQQLHKVRQKDEDRINKAIRTAVLGGRGGQRVIGTQIMKQRSILDGLDTIAAIQEGEVKPTAQVGQELASIIASVLKAGGQATESEIKGLMPETAKKKFADYATWLSSDPQDAMSNKMLSQFRHMLERENKFHSDKIKEVDAQLYYSIKPSLERKINGRYVNKDLLDNWGQLMLMKGKQMEQQPAYGKKEVIKPYDKAMSAAGLTSNESPKKVRVQLPDGRVGMIPKENLQRALDKGAKLL